MLHDFKSSDGDIITIKLSIHDKVPKTISRDGKKYKRLYSVPYVIIDSGCPKTVGALADKNTQRMKDSGELKKKPKTFDQRQQAQARKIAKMTPAQKENYVMTGKIVG